MTTVQFPSNDIHIMDCLSCKLSVFKVWLFVIIMSCTSFRVNLHAIVFLNAKEFLAWSRRHVWSLSDSNEIRTHNHFVRKWTLNHLAKLASLGKWLSVCLRTKWVRVPIPLLSFLKLSSTLKTTPVVETQQAIIYLNSEMKALRWSLG